jgi:glucokinase
MPGISKYAAGADIGGSHIHTCVVNLTTGRIVDGSRARIDTDSHSAAVRITDGWADCLSQSIALTGVKVVGAGFAFPGPFDYIKGMSRIEGVDKFEHIFGLDVAHSLRVRLDGEPIAFRWVNDASAFALGEALGGAARGLRRTVCLTLGSGVGSAFLDNGQIVTDATGVPADGWVYNLPFDDTIVDDSFSTRWFLRRWAQNHREVDGVAAIAALVGIDPAASELFEEYGRRLAQFAGPLCHDFECHDLLLGGNISRAWEFFGPSMSRELKNIGSTVTIHISELRDEASMVGAASLFANN